MVIIDEAQNIKNSDTSQTKAVKELKTDYRVAMTGTPVENRLNELWSIFDFINKGYLGTLRNFQKSYSTPNAGILIDPFISFNATKKLTGHGGLCSQVNKLKELGARPKKELPKELIEVE